MCSDNWGPTEYVDLAGCMVVKYKVILLYNGSTYIAVSFTYFALLLLISVKLWTTYLCVTAGVVYGHRLKGLRLRGIVATGRSNLFLVSAIFFSAFLLSLYCNYLEDLKQFNAIIIAHTLTNKTVVIPAFYFSWLTTLATLVTYVWYKASVFTVGFVE